MDNFFYVFRKLLNSFKLLNYLVGMILEASMEFNRIKDDLFSECETKMDEDEGSFSGKKKWVE